MHFQQQQQLPPLIPITKKRDLQTPQPQFIQQKSKNQSTKPKTQDRNDTQLQNKNQPIQSQQLNRNGGPNNNNQQKQQNSKIPKNIDEKKIQQFSQKFKNIQDKSANNKKSNKRSQQQKKQQNQKSKFLIAQMLNKISVKNISQELYPITNQTIQNVIFQMQQEIRMYKTQAQKKQNTLLTNPNNQHLKAEIANLEKSIDHCQTIKQLYHQKINFRNKIAILEGKNIQLRAENRDLKIKVNKGIEKIGNHMHVLPCQREKQLRQELNKCSEQLNKEKQMRQSLQTNIQQIIMNFKRLYDQADTARLIVTKKLRQIQQRQKKLNQAKLQFINENIQDQNSTSIKRSPKLEFYQDKKSPKPSSSNVHQSQNSTQRMKPGQQRPERGQKSNANDPLDRFFGQNDKTRTQIERKQEPKPMSFEQSIKKMRGNQNNFTKIYNKN